MVTGTDTTTTFIVILLALVILVWGFQRAKPYGKLGILAWLQSLVFVLPWILLFGLFSLGIFLNSVGILLLLTFSVGVYIYLGKRLREEGKDAILQQRAAQRLKEQQQSSSGETVKSENLEVPNLENSNSEPKTLVPEIIPIPEDDLKLIQGIFGIDTFFATETISYQEGAIFKGNLRGETDTVYHRLSDKLQQKVGDKYRLFLVESPEGKPVVIVLPSSNDPQPMTTGAKVLAWVLLLGTMATTLEAGGLILGFDWFSSPSRYPEILPIAGGLWLILFAHEMAHRVVAKRHNLRLSLPFLIPSIQIGSFGGITRFESLIPNRSVLFDVAFAGPAASGLVSLGIFLLGLILSHPGSYFKIPTVFFQSSVFVGVFAKLFLGAQLLKPLVDVHPLTVVGWFGLIITALNLMPAGQLDGGRIVQSIYGRKTARRATIATLVILAIIALVNPSNMIPLYWGIIILFVERGLERPSLNELTEPDDKRAAWGLISLFIMLIILIPLSSSFAGRLGIGT